MNNDNILYPYKNIVLPCLRFNEKKNKQKIRIQQHGK